ncbi:hypothetical protein cand_038340 [Cryptosporidium andersoni]|uniref:Uncharacterized protein n=1 Tax=Cryptosporidium andersoni TaxID=117008 RepID=A0A1J4MUP7_9CRYT|nr:hypothetical protein cand_038340 [Cryptosporidium andersoni]
MEQIDENKVSIHKASDNSMKPRTYNLSQLPKLARLDLNIIRRERSSNKENKCMKFNYEDESISQLGASITKKKSVEAVRNEESGFKAKQEPPNEDYKTFMTESSKPMDELYEISKFVKDFEDERNKERKDLENDIVKVKQEISEYKEKLLDYWIEITFLRTQLLNLKDESSS